MGGSVSCPVHLHWQPEAFMPPSQGMASGGVRVFSRIAKSVFAMLICLDLLSA